MNILGFPRGRSVNGKFWVSQGQIVSDVPWKGLGTIYRDSHRFLNDKRENFWIVRGKRVDQSGGKTGGGLRPFKPKCVMSLTETGDRGLKHTRMISVVRRSPTLTFLL